MTYVGKVGELVLPRTSGFALNMFPVTHTTYLIYTSLHKFPVYLEATSKNKCLKWEVIQKSLYTHAVGGECDVCVTHKSPL
jgi:hypothetical protein